MKKDLESYLPLIRKIAHRAKPHSRLEFNELVSEGVLALNDILEKNEYINTKGISFANFSWRRIYGAMMDASRKISLFKRNDHLDWDDLPEYAKKNRKRVKGYRAVSFDTKIKDDSQGEPIYVKDILKDNDIDALTECVTQNEFDRAMIIIGEASERMCFVFYSYYQMNMPLKKIGEIMGICESRVCQIKNDGLDTIRIKMDSKGA